jgi:hypothetical protein
LTDQWLKLVIDRMNGPRARDPYKRWFDLIRQKADAGAQVELVSLALIYRATGDAKYLDHVPAAPSALVAGFVKKLTILDISSTAL